MNTTLTVERLKELRSQLDYACSYNYSSANIFVKDWRETLYALIDAHLSPSAELGRMGGEISASNLLRASLQKDNGYAWAWHCNIAMPLFDAKVGLSHREANDCAAILMRHLFNVDIKESPEWKMTARNWSDDKPTPPPPADVQAVVEGQELIRLLECVRSLLRDVYEGRVDGTISRIDRAITFLQQRPFSEELRQAMLAGADALMLRVYPLPKNFPTRDWLEQWREQAALLTRAAEGKESGE
jgi:hypothetical protein